MAHRAPSKKTLNTFIKDKWKNNSPKWFSGWIEGKNMLMRKFMVSALAAEAT